MPHLNTAEAADLRRHGVQQGRLSAHDAGVPSAEIPGRGNRCAGTLLAAVEPGRQRYECRARDMVMAIVSRVVGAAQG